MTIYIYINTTLARLFIKPSVNSSLSYLETFFGVYIVRKVSPQYIYTEFLTSEYVQIYIYTYVQLHIYIYSRYMFQASAYAYQQAFIGNIYIYI